MDFNAISIAGISYNRESPKRRKQRKNNPHKRKDQPEQDDSSKDSSDGHLDFMA